jgi:nucleotide-binding universal stress UspA family protein
VPATHLPIPATTMTYMTAAIVETARRTDAEIVVVGGACRGRRFRGTIRDVLKKAPCRVLVIAACA